MRCSVNENVFTDTIGVITEGVLGVKNSSWKDLSARSSTKAKHYPQVCQGICQGSEDLGDVAGYSSQVCSSGVVPILTPSMWWSCRVLRTSWFLGGWTPGLGAGSGTRQNIEGDQWGLLPLLFSHRFKPKCQIDEFYTMLCSSVDSEHLLLSHQIQHLKGLGTF